MHRHGIRVLVALGIALTWSAGAGFAQNNEGAIKPKTASKRITQKDRAEAAARARAKRAEARKKVKAAKPGAAQTAGMTVAAAAIPIGQNDVPDYFSIDYANWAFTPPLRKFVDRLPLLGPTGANNLGQYIPVAKPDSVTYPGSDYYEIWLVEYTEKMHSDLPPTTLRGYVQMNNGTDTTSCGGAAQPACTASANTLAPDPVHYLGPLIVAQRNRPVRIKFVNKLPTGPAGKLPIPVDMTVMGAGPGHEAWNGTQRADLICASAIGAPTPPTCMAENRADIHLHGGKTPWISDGTPHQWVTPAGETTNYAVGFSTAYVPDMPNPGPGAVTYYYTNQQSARLMFYHDHASGITRLNVYAGMAAGYLLTDDAEKQLVNSGLIPAEQIPLVIQDKTFVDAANILNDDPTWKWGTGPIQPNGARAPNSGDLWWPHVYLPAQNPYDLTGVNPTGRWMYGPWFWPPTSNIPYLPVPNPYFDCDPFIPGPCTRPWEPPEIPGVPNTSWVGEAFMDTPVVNGTAYPTLTVEPKAYRFRILNAAADRFWNLQIYKADPAVPAGCPTCAANSEVKMVPAIPGNPTFPPLWPIDGREGGVPDPLMVGPDFYQIGTEGGFLPKPVLVKNQPITWNRNPTTFNAGNVQDHALLLGPAERADVIIDFSAYADQTLILYNDAPAAFPALDPRLDYYTGNPDFSMLTGDGTGGHTPTQVGFGPNTRTIMQIKVGPTVTTPSNFNPTALATTLPQIFATAQEPIIVGQSAYNGVYPAVPTFPTTWPYWGVSRIQDSSIAFKKADGVNMVLPMQPKAMHDEMGAAYDDFGRMSAKLGLEMPVTTNINQTFVLRNYIDPPNELVSESQPGVPTAGDGTQIWKITHNGVDTHPIHFHIFDVQLINRVGWDGAIRLPDANELGWKDTVRISPLEDTIVAVRPVAPKMPFGIPDSIRPLAPELPIGATAGFTNVDVNGNPIVPPVTNQLYNFGWEYVWHCHILSHEEADMMRPIQLAVARALPTAPVLSRTGVGVPVVLTWTDATPVVDPNAPANLGNPANEIGFRIQRADVNGGVTGAYAQIGAALANITTYTDTTAVGTNSYAYRVVAYNAAGDSVSNVINVAPTVAPPAAPTNLTATAISGTQIRLNWTDNSNNETGFTVQRATDNAFTLNVVSFNVGANTTTYTDSTPVAGTQYFYRVIAVNGTVQSGPSNVVTITLVALGAPSNLTVAILTGPSVRLTWVDNSSTETGFLIERATNSAFSANLVSFNAAANATTYTDATVVVGNTYYFRVWAVNGAVRSATPSNTVIAGPPAVPTNMTATQAAGATNVIVTFRDNATNEANFTLQRAVVENGVVQGFNPKATLPARAGTGNVSYSDSRTTFTPGQTLTYRVRSNNALGSSGWLQLGTPILTH